MTRPYIQQYGLDWSGDYYDPMHWHIHAMGVVAVNYNSLELTLFALFSEYIGSTRHTELLYAEINNHIRLDVFRALLDRYEKNAEMKTAVEHFLACYEICTENRNTLMHSRVDNVIYGNPRFTLLKGSRRTPVTQLSMDVPLHEIRRIADDIFETEGFAWDIRFYMHTKAGVLDVNHELARTALPDIFPKPGRLILPPHTTQPVGGDPPKS